MIYRGENKNNLNVIRTKYCVKVTEKCQFWLNIALMRKTDQWVLMTSKENLRPFETYIKATLNWMHLHTSCFIK